MHLNTFSPEEWPLTMDISIINNSEHPERNTGQNWSSISSMQDILHTMHNIKYLHVTGTHRLQSFRGVSPNHGSFKEQQRGTSWTMQQVKIKTVYSQRTIVNILAVGILYRIYYRKHAHSSKYPWKGYTIQAQAANILEAGYTYTKLHSGKYPGTYHIQANI